MTRRNDEKKDSEKQAGAKILPFNPFRKLRERRAEASAGTPSIPDRPIAAMVTITRFIGDQRVHAQVPVFADEVIPDGATANDVKLLAELSELLADAAVEANSYLDRVANTAAARTFAEFQAS